MAEPIFAKSLYCRKCLQRLSSRTSIRNFTSSSPRRKHGALSSFTPTSSPELDALLSTFRTNIFLPAHLLKLQQNLIYRKKNQRLLTDTDQPATAKIGNEVHALKPLNRLTDEPSTSKSLAQMVELCKEGKDWVNMVPFLIELKTAGRKVKGPQFEKMVRRMGEKGGLGVVIEMARRVEGTGMRLGEIGIAREALWGAVMKYIRSEQNEAAVHDAHKFIEAIWELLSDERHVDRPATGKKTSDPKTHPEIIGVLLWIRALKASLLADNQDADGTVKRAAEMVLAVWNRDKNKTNNNNNNTGDDENTTNWYDANRTLIMWAPVWHGMKMARGIVGENTVLGRDLANAVSLDLEPMLKEAQRVVAQHVGEDVTRRGLVVYEELSKMAE
ncbi:hypothetical protein XANCAGTX0491_009531 [Xanthoria calcicola]